jgi:hypothetical protein
VASSHRDRRLLGKSFCRLSLQLLEIHFEPDHNLYPQFHPNQSVVGLQLISMSLKEGAGGFELRRAGPFGLSPYVARISIPVKPKAR